MTTIIISVSMAALAALSAALCIWCNRRLKQENCSLKKKLVALQRKSKESYLLSCASNASEIAGLQMKLFLAEEKNAQLRLTIQKKDMLLRQKWENAARGKEA